MQSKQGAFKSRVPRELQRSRQLRVQVYVSTVLVLSRQVGRVASSKSTYVRCTVYYPFETGGIRGNAFIKSQAVLHVHVRIRIRLESLRMTWMMDRVPNQAIRGHKPTPGLAPKMYFAGHGSTWIATQTLCPSTGEKKNFG